VFLGFSRRSKAEQDGSVLIALPSDVGVYFLREGEWRDMVSIK